MDRFAVLFILVLILTACGRQISTSKDPTPAVTASQVATPIFTETPASIPSLTPTKLETSTPAPDKELVSPNGQFIARLYSEYQHPSEKQAIEIWDDQELVLWVVPYQGEMPTYDPRPSLAISQWAPDSSRLYFYYSFAYDGWVTLFDGNDLQSIEIQTGEINTIAPGCCIAFAFSPDMNELAYIQDAKLTIRDIQEETERKAIIQSKGYKQAGPILWSPNGNTIAFYVLTDDDGHTQLISVMVESQKQLVIMDFDIEESVFAGWSEEGALQYILEGSVIRVDPRTGSRTTIGTPTPLP